MPGSFRNEAERRRLGRFPAEILPEDLIVYFTLSDWDRALVQEQ